MSTRRSYPGRHEADPVVEAQAESEEVIMHRDIEMSARII